MNCFDDLYVSSNYKGYHFAENVDYLSNDIHISNECLVKCYKQLKFDISVIIPSTVSIRLKNIVWRRLYKNLNGLEEIDPTIINWYKDYDINWCYGPKYNDDALLHNQSQEVQQYQPQVASSQVSALMMDEDNEEEFIEYTEPNSNALTYTVSNSSTDSVSECDSDSLMSNNSSNSSINSSYTRQSQKQQPVKQVYPNGGSKKSVKFNFIINSREIINGISIDYDFLDNNLLSDV